MQSPMIQPRHLIPLVKTLLMEQPATIEDIHGLLATQGISVSIRGLRHVLESYPIHFRRHQDQWHPVVIGSSSRLAQSARETSTNPPLCSASSPLPLLRPSTAGSCRHCGMSHVDGSSCSLSHVWR